MRKIYSLVLMAAALLVGTNAWAQTNGKVKIVRTGVEYNRLQLAFDAAQDGDLLELTNNMTELMDSAAWFGEPTSSTLENFASTDRSITLDLKGYTYNIEGDAPYKIALTRGVLTIQSTGGKGNIVSNENGIAVYGTYLKIDAKKTPFAHLMIKENVKITSESKTVVLNTPVTPYEVKTASWKWNTYPLDYNCCIFPVSQHGISNGARIDVYGELMGKKYAVQVSGNIRSSREFINKDGSRKTVYYNGVEQASNLEIFPIYWKKSDTELYLPGTTLTDKTKNGTEGTPTYYGGSYYYNSTISNTDDYVLAWEDDSLYSSYVHIHSSAILTTNNPNSTKATAFYSAGYARCYIEGTCKGSTGVYVKGGEVELHDAQISSNYEGTYVAADGSNHSGVDAGGSGVVVESNKGWTGNMEVTVSGDTYVEGSTGYAIDESVTSSPTTKVDIINIEGGTFVGGSEGTVMISETTVIANQQDPEDVQIIIAGGNMQNGTTTIGTQDLETFLGSQDNNTHVTTVTVDGKTTMVVSEGAAPTSKETRTTWNNIVPGVNGIVGYADSIKTIKADSIVNAKWTGTGDPNNPAFESSLMGYGYITSGETVKLGELQMISGTSATDQQVLRINSGATLDVRHLMMNDFAQIIVEAGGKLIVNGKQGIIASNPENIVLKADASNQATFVIAPEVTSNKQPNATVQLYTTCYKDGENSWKWQRFAAPMTITPTPTKSEDTPTGVKYVDDVTEVWTSINAWSELKPFMAASITNNTSEGGVIYTFAGKLMGNVTDSIVRKACKWNYYGNSYMAPMSVKALSNALPVQNVDPAIYYWDVNAQGYKSVTAQMIGDFSFGILTEIPAMGFFVLKNTAQEAGALNIDYNNSIFRHAQGLAPVYNAPVRHTSNSDRVCISVIAENGYSDVVYLLGSDNFTPEYEAGADVEKLMNNGLNLYVAGDINLSALYTDNLLGATLTLQSNEAINYSMSFNNVNGEYALRDNMTGRTIAIVEGATYNFSAQPNETIEGRFQIVGRQEMPTAVETVEEMVNTPKAIYTVMGQYVGETTDWNNLPAGVYVVDGVKVIK